MSILPARKFDRLVRFDERSRNYPIRALFAPDIKPRSYTWACKLWLDQGSEGACTGFSMSHELAAKPVVVSGISNAFAIALYKRAQELDDWPGTNYEGSSVLGAMKAAMEKGYYTEYRWAFGEEDLAMAVGHHGPAVIGINWYEDMFEADRNGNIKVGGALAGGHAILCNGFNVKKGVYRLHNSWGAGWALNGECFISRADMTRLLKEQGEACVPVARKQA